ncbi:MAG: hypothetical protein NC311_08730 [Muribaculaceae bacterium]|nr:hypothetical protein [Muribaculaceae bacterium]MCM1399864.1 hypothetical protein [Clostridium sp.]MCM1460651.1 hypothetical protein [Bacteroides sp.]
MEADGSVIIDTRLDIKGFDEGIKKANARMLTLDSSIRRTKQEISRITSEMKGLENSQVPTEEYDKLSAKVKAAEQSFNSLIARRGVLENDGVSVGDKAWISLNNQIERALLKLQGYEAELDAVEVKSKSGTETAKYAKLAGQLDKMTAKLSEQCMKYDELSAKENKVGKGVKNLAASAKKGFAGFLSGTKNANSGMGGLTKGVKSFTSRLLGIAKSVFVFAVISKALSALKERMSTLIAGNTQLSSSLAQMKGNMNTAFQSIFSAALPALTALFNMLVRVTAVIAQFTSALFGKSIKASQAAAKAADKQASSIGGVGSAAKKASKQLASFDDAQILRSNDDSSGGGGGGSTGIGAEYADIDGSSAIDNFVKKLKDSWAKADFTDLGKSLGEKINAALSSINWTKIKSTCSRIAKSLATFLNGFLYGTDWTLVGETLAEGINTAILTLYTFVTTFDFSALGKSIVNSINGFIRKTDWKQTAVTISGCLKGALSTVISLITGIDWASIGRSIVQFVVNIDWLALAGQLAVALLGFVTSAFELLFGMVGELCTSIGDFFEQIGLNSIAGFFKGIGDSLATAAEWIKNVFNTYIVQPIKNFFGIHSPSTLFAEIGTWLIAGLKNGITSTISAIPGIFKSIFTNAWSAIKNIFSNGNITSFFGNIVTSIKNLFSNVGSAIASAVSKTFASGVNGVFGTIENIVNGFINSINNCIGLINKIPGVNIGRLSTISLPRLASGTVVPANYGEFLAVLGDNKRETEVVSPLSTIRQAVMEALIEAGGLGGGDINLTINLDGQAIYKSVVKYNNRNTAITRRNALAQ